MTRAILWNTIKDCWVVPPCKKKVKDHLGPIWSFNEMGIPKFKVVFLWKYLNKDFLPKIKVLVLFVSAVCSIFFYLTLCKKMYADACSDLGLQKVKYIISKFGNMGGATLDF